MTSSQRTAACDATYRSPARSSHSTRGPVSGAAAGASGSVAADGSARSAGRNITKVTASSDVPTSMTKIGTRPSVS